MGQAALQHGPGGGIEWHRVWSVAQPERLGLVVDVIDAQLPGLLAGGSMQEREYPDQGLMRVSIGVGGPAAEQGALLVEGEGAAAEGVGFLGGQAFGGVGQQQVLGAGEAEELPQHGQPSLAGLGHVGEECLDVVDVDQRPLAFAPAVGQEAGEVAQDGQRGLEGGVAARPGSRPAGAFPRPQHRLGEAGHGEPQWFGNLVDTALPPAARQLLGLVGGQSQPAAGEEVLQRPRQRAHGAPWHAGAVQQRRGEIGLLVFQQPPQGADQRGRSAGAVSGGGVSGELAQPGRWIRQPGDEVIRADERLIRVALPAG
jgi:hypothetical protein